jgi:hypothetical protein
MNKQPRQESKGRRITTSNKLKRAALQKKRELRREEAKKVRRAKLPAGAVAADLAQQVPNNSYGGRPLYYVDQPFTCVTCGRAEVWTATQQKWYYEVAKGSLYGRAIRCGACRRRVREQRDAQRARSNVRRTQ